MAEDEDQTEDNQTDDNAENEEGEDGEGEESSGGGKKKLIIIIAAVLLLLIGGGAGLYFMGMLDGLLGKTEEMHCEVDEHGEEHCEPVEHAEGEEDHGKDGKKSDKKGKKKGKKDDHGDGYGEKGAGGFVAVPPMIVNLNTDEDVQRYLRLTVQFELVDEADSAAVEAVIPRVVDQFQTYLRELRVRDLRGSAGIYRLQMELLWRVNQAAAPIEIKDVLFQEILIQ